MLEVIPGILEQEWGEIEQKIELVRPFAKTIHIDLADGKMVPNTTFLDPTPFARYTKDIFFELHMMVEEPINYLKPFAEAGFKRFLGHIEKMSDQEEFVAQGQLLGEVGLAVDGKSEIDSIKVPYDDLDAVLIMTINAGFSGQVFMPEMLEKIKILKPFGLSSASLTAGAQGGQVQNDIKVEVDGGINDQTIKLAKDAGVTRFVTTSFLFKDSPQKQFELLQQKLIDS